MAGELEVENINRAMTDAMIYPSIAGSCIGFMIFNKYPAKIFMGDTGSLALGAGLSVGAIFTHMELLLPIVGLIFVIEALSVIIQVGSFKIRKGKRVFKMAPLHHHYELSGWHEKKVVAVFVTVTFIMCLISTVILIVQGNSLV
jgi:phospho-N-acetylmuramoyl-pentapeptide-transferase